MRKRSPLCSCPMDVGQGAKPHNSLVFLFSLSLLPPSLQYSLFHFDFSRQKFLSRPILYFILTLADRNFFKGLFNCFIAYIGQRRNLLQTNVPRTRTFQLWEPSVLLTAFKWRVQTSKSFTSCKLEQKSTKSVAIWTSTFSFFTWFFFFCFFLGGAGVGGGGVGEAGQPSIWCYFNQGN